ncbi:MCE family protein [Amycolatopsis nigrescens]|uniref:MCE family protein n=1 Tax=Amycolatopsis nigrescens TaxID=381445 RepID=UPI00037C411B|nr:MCE family protein [Amycolatopsis nigrescens]
MSAGKRFGTQLAGVVFLVILALLLWLTVAIYDKKFTKVDMVTLQTDRVGNQLDEQADVKVKGVPFGTVRAIRPTSAGAEIDLAMDPAKIGQLPRNMSARLLPKSAFGERYVNLILPERADPRPLRDGDVIPQDRSSNAIEIEKVLGDLLPLLRAVQPQKLNSSLGAIAMALDGKGKPLGDSIVQFNDLLEKTNPLMPEFKADISRLADVSDVYNTAAPDILRALTDLSVTGKTLVDHKSDLEALFASTTKASEDLNGFLQKNSGNIIGLSESSRPTLELLAKYSPSFPCLFDSVNRLKPVVEKALGKGTNEPGLHVQISVQPARGKYVPGKDDVRYPPGSGPRCYGQGAGASGGGQSASAFAADDLGLVNSPADRQMVSELMGPALGIQPAEVPDWSSVLVGPLFRGAEVTIK